LRRDGGDLFEIAALALPEAVFINGKLVYKMENGARLK
jgi:hypothetical protein